MPVYFNDLTLDKRPEQNRALLRGFRGLWADFASKVGTKDARILANEEGIEAVLESLQDSCDCGMVANNADIRELTNFVSTVLCRRYLDPDADEWEREAENRFWGSEFTIRIKPSNVPECPAMGWAFVNGSITMGFMSNYFWKTCRHRIVETDLEDNKSSHDVFCVTDRAHLKDSFVMDWMARRRAPAKVPAPVKTDLNPEEKHVHVRDDHGQDVLADFGRCLCRSPYVEKIVNSTEWHPHCGRFILSCRDDGIIHVCLHWTDVGLGLAVQTTGTSKAQTEVIARMLEEEFDHGS